ncbi:MAG TPA: SH3 domain-containing protein [Anaerolineales bacterium]|nr:SH3 domain-containing protein [Anaerolineales bacterium]
MKHNRKLTLLGIILIFAIVGCNIPGGPQPSDSVIQTAAAQTLQVILTPSIAITGTVQQVPSPTPNTPAPSATQGGVATQTPTYSVPMLTVREQTNCRTGPGQDYEVIFTYLPGKELEILGRYEQDNYWLVKSDETSIGNCWLWGEFVEVTGSYWTVPSVTPPPTSTQAPPQAPSIVEWRFDCSSGLLMFTVSWIDRAVDESGYRVFRNEEAVAELAANSTSYTDTFDFTAGENVDYYLQVYSPFGSANSSVMRMVCGG